MSGSDSGYSSGVGGFGGGGLACENLAFETLLTSPKADVLAQFTVGDVLEIELLTTHGVETVVAKFNGQIAGGLVANQDKVKDCIDKGFSFIADVREKNGAKVKVFVQCSA